MAERDVIMPGARTPIVDSKGLINPTWLRFFVDLHERTGGGATDKVETAETTAEAAQTTADTALATASGAESGGVENSASIQEFEFLGDWDLR